MKNMCLFEYDINRKFTTNLMLAKIVIVHDANHSSHNNPGSGTYKNLSYRQATLFCIRSVCLAPPLYDFLQFICQHANLPKPDDSRILSC